MLFFTLAHNVRETFPIVFSGGRRHKVHSAEYKEFGENWGFQKILFELAGEKVEKVAQVNQIYLTDGFTFLTYSIQKADMEQTEDEFQENLRKAKSKHK